MGLVLAEASIGASAEQRDAKRPAEVSIVAGAGKSGGGR
jgi:hypothetical protein